MYLSRSPRPWGLLMPASALTLGSRLSGVLLLLPWAALDWAGLACLGLQSQNLPCVNLT